MAREKIFDPDYQKSFTEAIHRENQIRRNWNLEYGILSKKSEAVKWDDDPSSDEADEVLQRKDTYLSRAPQPRPMPSKEDRAWPASTAPATNTIPRVSQPPLVMKPVSKDIKQILYQGLSHDGEGRAQYLRRRWRDSPEQKYYFPVCSSWQYGWTYGMDDTGFLNCPKHNSRQA